MPRDVDYSAVETRIDECVDAAGDSLEERRYNDDDQTVMWLAQRGDWRYTIDKMGDSDFLHVSFSYDIPFTLEQALIDHDVDRILQASDVDTADIDDEQRGRMAALTLLENTPEDIQASFANDLIQLMSHPELSFEFKTTDAGVPYAFTISKPIYPYSDDFTFGEFDGAAQSVVTVGHAAVAYTNRSLDVQEAVQAQTPSEPPTYIR